MLKSILFVALVANVLFLVYSTEVVCGKNEVYSKCINGGCIGARNCSELGIPIRCVKIDPNCCKGGCLCKTGYLRNSNDVCIPEEKCCDCKENKHYSNCTNGGCYGARHCYEKGNPVECYDVCPKDCIKGCLCDKGYLKDKYGNCIPEKMCPPKCNKTNEVYEKCPATCPARTCGIDDRLVRCVTPPKVGDPNCQPPGCICASGYFRHPNEDCVKWEDCPTCKQPHEYYDPCPDRSEQTCESINKQDLDAKKANSTVCHGECRCDPDYFRNLIGECITKKQCMQCPGPHEYFSCRGACDNVCKDLSKQNQTNCPIINKKCTENCYCEEGYARNARNICVPFMDCEPECKGQNEEYSICANGGCSKGLKCTDLGELIICKDPVKCKGGCVCKDGFHRNDKFVCISEKDCRGNCSSTEIFSNCTLGHCRGELCSQKNKTIICTAKGYPCEKGCICQKYHLRAPNGTCVPEDQCPPETPACGCNEVYSECTQGVCRAQLCLQKGKPVPCPDIKPGSCKRGCICKEKHLRDKSGHCIPEDQCTDEDCE